jgi:hypothetical protein
VQNTTPSLIWRISANATRTAILGLTAGLACAQNTPLALEHEGIGCIFLGEFDKGQFVQAPELSEAGGGGYSAAAKRILAKLPLHKRLTGIDLGGKPAQIAVERVEPEPDLEHFSVEVKYIKGTSKTGVLFGTSALPIRLLHSLSTFLSADIESALSEDAMRLWVKHLPERADDEQPKSFQFRKPTVTQFQEAPEIITVYYPVDIEEQDGAHDDRGSFFFIYSRTDRRVVYSEFGHPEWSPGATTLIIKPEMYFRMGSKPDLYLLGEHQGGWEDWGHAIFNLRTGKTVLYCY